MNYEMEEEPAGVQVVVATWQKILARGSTTNHCVAVRGTDRHRRGPRCLHASYTKISGGRPWREGP